MSAPPPTIISGHCGIRRHPQCLGVYGGYDCRCECHTAPEPQAAHVEPRHVQVRRSEVWRTDPDGSWRVIGLAERAGHPDEAAAVAALLAHLGINLEEYQP